MSEAAKEPGTGGKAASDTKTGPRRRNQFRRGSNKAFVIVGDGPSGLGGRNHREPAREGSHNDLRICVSRRDLEYTVVTAIVEFLWRTSLAIFLSGQSTMPNGGKEEVGHPSCALFI